MHKIRRFYNQNKKAIWRAIGIIVFLFAILQIFNHWAGRNDNLINNTDENNKGIVGKKYNDIYLSSNKSAITDTNMTSNQEQKVNIIDQFFEYCNNKSIDEAYNLITNECKDELYPTLEDFKKGYYDPLFKGSKKNIIVENWIGDTYKIDIQENALATGIYNEDESVQDYITVIDGENNKLNINGYIGRTDINKINDIEDKKIQINILRNDMYMDYDTYTFEVINNSDDTILLDDLSYIDSLYIKDENDIKYYAYTHELIYDDLKIEPKERKEYTIKFYSRFISDKKIKGIGFSKITMNYNSSAYYYDCYIEF